jgi:hypothetical protein
VEAIRFNKEDSDKRKPLIKQTNGTYNNASSSADDICQNITVGPIFIYIKTRS